MCCVFGRDDFVRVGHGSDAAVGFESGEEWWGWSGAFLGRSGGRSEGVCAEFATYRLHSVSVEDGHCGDGFLGGGDADGEQSDAESSEFMGCELGEEFRRVRQP